MSRPRSGGAGWSGPAGIVEVVFCPHPPLLLPELVGQQDAGAPVREACLAALGDALAGATGAAGAAGPDRVVLVGGVPASPVAARGAAPGLSGTTAPGLPGTTGAPLSLRVGRMLLTAAGWSGPVHEVPVPFDAPVEEVRALGAALGEGAGGRRTLLLVLGDGSARRGEKAPGHLDPRAHDVDAAAFRALREGDPEALLGLDPALAADLLVAGRAAWQVAAAAVPGPTGAKSYYEDDPFGVMYAVVRWTCDS